MVYSTAPSCYGSQQKATRNTVFSAPGQGAIDNFFRFFDVSWEKKQKKLFLKLDLIKGILLENTKSDSHISLLKTQIQD